MAWSIHSEHSRALIKPQPGLWARELRQGLERESLRWELEAGVARWMQMKKQVPGQDQDGQVIGLGAGYRSGRIVGL